MITGTRGNKKNMRNIALLLCCLMVASCVQCVVSNAWTQKGLDEFHSNLAAYSTKHNPWLTGNFSHILEDVVIDSFNGFMIGHYYDSPRAVDELLVLNMNSGNYAKFQMTGPGIGLLVSSKVVDSLGNVYFLSKSRTISINKFNFKSFTLQQQEIALPPLSKFDSLILTPQFNRLLVSVDKQFIYSIDTNSLNIVWKTPITISSNLVFRQDNGVVYFLARNTFMELDVSSGKIFNYYDWSNDSVEYGKMAYAGNGWFSIIYNNNLLSFYSIKNNYIVQPSRLAGEFESCHGLGYSTSEIQLTFLSYCYEQAENSPLSIYKLNATQKFPSITKAMQLASPNFQTNLAALNDKRTLIAIGLKDGIQIVNVENGQVVKQVPRESGTSVEIYASVNGMLYLVGINGQRRVTNIQSIPI
ncbi:predicted protein [Naegleria gruberi]|uniref:Predicted protein n=1 Tax=Naegleria gruberi TaxID=5762 RepID=D2VUP2_NAEGR|nr:uncharacterized protein NAEGRDRAFT_52401 [Naegleria gruberi]EFC39542.1 predicted protein [Naegleria gruberi]|eukprot:XP_002672286.1 predicted protein [Naegleria gruberi strain NEG-M]